MMTVNADPVFLDTNVLVYASVDTSPFYLAAQTALTNLNQAHVQLWISRQILREYLATLARPNVGIPISNLTNAIRYFETHYQIAEDSPLVTAQLLTLLEQGYSHQIQDTNIVATMLTYGIRRILTNNPNDFTPFASLITILPLI